MSGPVFPAGFKALNTNFIIKMEKNTVNRKHLDHVKSIFSALKSERIRQGKSQMEIAERMGVDRSAVSKMEAGANISIFRTVEFAEILGQRIKITDEKGF